MDTSKNRKERTDTGDKTNTRNDEEGPNSDIVRAIARQKAFGPGHADSPFAFARSQEMSEGPPPDTAGKKTVEDRAKELARQRVPRDLRPDGRPVAFNERNPVLKNAFTEMARAEKDAEIATKAFVIASNLPGSSKEVIRQSVYQALVSPAQSGIEQSKKTLRKQVTEDPTTFGKIFEAGSDSDSE